MVLTQRKPSRRKQIQALLHAFRRELEHQDASVPNYSTYIENVYREFGNKRFRHGWAIGVTGAIIGSCSALIGMGLWLH